MKKIMFAFVGASTLFALSAAAETWNGVISDAKCGAAHADASAKAMKCVAGCVKGGQAPVLVSDGKVYKIDDASKEKVMAHLGHKVKVTGSMDGDTVKIDSVEME